MKSNPGSFMHEAIERRTFQSEAMNWCLGAALRLRSGQALRTEFLERTPERKASAGPSTIQGIEAIRLCASLFQAHLSIDRVASFSSNRE
jgi:hypothetical protein